MTTQKARLESERSKRSQSYQKKTQALALFLISGLLAVIIFALGYWTGQIRVVEGPPEQIRAIVQDESSKTVEAAPRGHYDSLGSWVYEPD